MRPAVSEKCSLRKAGEGVSEVGAPSLRVCVASVLCKMHLEHRAEESAESAETAARLACAGGMPGRACASLSGDTHSPGM